MKKLAILLSITALLVCAFFVNVRLTRSNDLHTDLVSEIASNIAYAEGAETTVYGCKYTGDWTDTCVKSNLRVIRCEEKGGATSCVISS